MDPHAEEQKAVVRGARWALGLGTLTVLGGLLLTVVALRGTSADTASRGVAMFSGVVSALFGAVTLYLGLRLRNPAMRRASQFTALLWMYGIGLALGVLDLVVTLATGGRPTGTLGLFLAIGALLAFSHGRKVLRSLEAETLQGVELPPSDLQRELQRTSPDE